MERKNTLIVGAPQKGKTFWAEKRAVEYAKNGGTAVAYNVGREKDFAKFISVSFITPEIRYSEMRSKGLKVRSKNDLPQRIDYFKINDTGKIYHVKDFCKLFKGKCVKIERLTSKGSDERMFFKVIFEYFYNTLILFDDFRGVTRYGLGAEFITLVSRINHAGKKYAPPEMTGVDIAYIYHSFDTVTEELFIYCNTAVQFFTAVEPEVKGNSELERVFRDNYQFLRSAPKYSRCEIDTQNYISKKITFN